SDRLPSACADSEYRSCPRARSSGWRQACHPIHRGRPCPHPGRTASRASVASLRSRSLDDRTIVGIQLCGRLPYILATDTLLPRAITGDERPRIGRKIMVRRIADEERHSLLEPGRCPLPPGKSELLGLEHMNV